MPGLIYFISAGLMFTAFIMSIYIVITLKGKTISEATSIDINVSKNIEYQKEDIINNISMTDVKICHL